MKIGAIVLAAGEGRRFGGNKLLYKIRGKPIISYVIESLRDLERVIISGKYVKDLVDFLPTEVIIYNPRWSEGISSSIKLGLRFYKDYDGVLIALADMPLVRKKDVEKIISTFNEDCDAVVPTYNGQWGNPVLISKRLFENLMNIKGDEGARQVIRNNPKLNICKVECSIGVLIDIDTVEDLQKIENLMAESY